METAEKVRLVRCPNCENVLPEIPEYSVYQCGGCGIVLRSKGKFRDDKFVSERGDEERIGAVGEAMEKRSGNLAVPFGVLATRDVEPGVSSLSLDQRQADKSVRDAKPGIVETKGRSGKGVAPQNENTPGISLNGEAGGFRFQADYESHLQKLKPVSGWRKSGPVDVVGSLKDGYSGSRAVRYSTSKYPDEGPSDYIFAPVHNNRDEPLRKHDIVDCGDGVRLLQRDHKKLLRELDDLKNQLSQSFEVGRESRPANRSTVRRDTFGNRNACSPVSSFGLSKMLQQDQSGANRHSAGLPYITQYPSSLRHPNGPDVTHNYDPGIRNSNHYSGFCDHYSTHMHRSLPGCGLYDRVPPHGLISGQYLDASCDPFGPVPTSLIPHRPTCSCFHRVSDPREAAALAPQVAFCKSHPNVSPSKGLHYFDSPGEFESSYIGPRQAFPSYGSHLQHPHFRRHSELNSEGFMDRRPQSVLAFGAGRRAHPITGGAPFLTCGSCFELLQLPSSVLLKAKNRGKFRCGACNAVISYDLVDRKQLVFSAQAEAIKATAEAGDSSCEVIKSGYIQSHGYVTGAGCRFFSDEYNDSGFDCLSSERARATLMRGINLSLTTSQEMESISPGLSDQENSPAVLVTSGDSAQQVVDAKHSPLTPGSPLQEHLDHSSRDHSSKRFGKGNRSSWSDHEVLSNKAVMRQNSLQEATPPAEMEMSFNESSDNFVSGDSGDANRERYKRRANKGESFLSNIFKKSFKDLSRSGQGDERGKGKVFINGHPIPDRSIKKAEKLAGPIRSGKYWYDFRAGFWGITSGPCLGIIPVRRQSSVAYSHRHDKMRLNEFNYPMTKDCACGNTGVFVNGRELHQKDLDLLASRGLPLDRNRSYVIEISGRVYDENTGEELDCLGKLAPTVEEVKHGFGMRGGASLEEAEAVT